MRSILLLALALFWNVAAFAGAAEQREFFSNKSYWGDFQWDKAASSALWSMPGWSESEQRDEKATWVKERNIVTFQRTGKASLSVANDDKPFRHRAHVTFELGSKECRELFQKLTELFGKPIENDASFMALYFSQDNYVRLLNTNYQWDVGATRISGGCIGTESAEDVKQQSSRVTGSLFFTHSSRQEKLEPPIILRCTQNLRFSDGRDAGPRDDIVLTVNPSFKQVTNAAGSRLDSSGFEADDAHFGFVREDTETKITGKWRIDRMSGALRIEMFRGGTAGATVTGTCERLEKLEKKF